MTSPSDPRSDRPLSPVERREIELLRRRVARFGRPDARRSVLQLASCVLPAIGLWCLMIRSGPSATTVGLAILLGLLMLRAFGLYHDLAHGSMFRSRRVNEIVGCLVGVWTLTPYHQWRHEHARHHAAVGNLDGRGRGDVPILTCEELARAPWWRREAYRLFRWSPITFLGAGAYLFFIRQRIPTDPRARTSVHLTTLASATMLGLAYATLGPAMVLTTIVPAYLTLGACAMWLYNLQHFFPGVRLQHGAEWDYVRGCLEGSSYYRLPLPLQWLAANTGFHHLHHLFPRVPNYHLPRCQEELERLELSRRVRPVTLRSSIEALRLGLYDEHRHVPVALPPLSLASSGREDAGHAGP